MAGINYDTDLVDSFSNLNTHVDINKGKVSNYKGIGGFMNKLCTKLDAIEEETINLKQSFIRYHEEIENVPLPLSPEDIEKNIVTDSKYRYSKVFKDGGFNNEKGN